MKHRLAIAGFAATAAVMAAPVISPGRVQAGDHDWLRAGETEVVTTRLSLEGFDLSTKEGVARLRKRIRREAGRICEGVEDGPLVVTLNAEACRREAVRDAYREVERLALAAAARKLAAR